MKFLWPNSLILLGLFPLLIGVYFWLLRRKKRRYAVRFSSLSLVRQALSAQSRWRRYVPPMLFLLASISLTVGLARPAVTTLVPAGRATVMLVMDVSSSMLQTDIAPSRLAAAQEAALDFVERQQANNQIGIVAFASVAQLVQAPTIDPDDLKQAIVNLGTGRGTAIGSGIITALDTIEEFNQSQAASKTSAEATATPAEEGDYQPDIVVLLTDGMYSTGTDPLDAAQEAVDAGIRIYTIGYGTNGAGRSNLWGGMGGGTQGIDEESLKEIASMTGGEYFSASSANELQKVFAGLPTVLVTREETLEISVLFVGIGAALMIVAVVLSQMWHPLP